jgi:hypothetical protein
MYLQARQRRKEQDPAVAAARAAQEQRLELLQQQHAKKKQQQQQVNEGFDSALSEHAMQQPRLMAEAAAAAAAQDEQLQMLLQQLRGAAGFGSRGSSPAPDAGSSSNDSYADAADEDEEVEEDEGLDAAVGDDVDAAEYEDYSNALALAAAVNSTSDPTTPAPHAQAVGEAAGKAWSLVMASLEGEEFAAVTASPSSAADGPELSFNGCVVPMRERQPAVTGSGTSRQHSNDDSLLPLLQHDSSPVGSFAASSSISKLVAGSDKQPQQQQLDRLEQQLESALAHSDAVTADAVIDDIYRMSLSFSAQTPSSSDNHLGPLSRGWADWAPPVNGFKHRKGPRISMAQALRNERAAAAFVSVMNSMFGNILGDSMPPAPVTPSAALAEVCEEVCGAADPSISNRSSSIKSRSNSSNSKHSSSSIGSLDSRRHPSDTTTSQPPQLAIIGGLPSNSLSSPAPAAFCAIPGASHPRKGLQGNPGSSSSSSSSSSVVSKALRGRVSAELVTPRVDEALQQLRRSSEPSHRPKSAPVSTTANKSQHVSITTTAAAASHPHAAGMTVNGRSGTSSESASLAPSFCSQHQERAALPSGVGHAVVVSSSRHLQGGHSGGTTVSQQHDGRLGLVRTSSSRSSLSTGRVVRAHSAAAACSRPVQAVVETPGQLHRPRSSSATTTIVPDMAPSPAHAAGRHVRLPPIACSKTSGSSIDSISSTKLGSRASSASISSAYSQHGRQQHGAAAGNAAMHEHPWL